MADALLEDVYQARRQRALVRRNRRRARTIVLLSVCVAAGVAIWVLTKVQRPLARGTAAEAGVPAAPVAARDTIRKGDGMVAALIRAGLSRRDASAVLEASELRATARRAIPLALYADSTTAPVREVEFQVADDRSIPVMRSIGDGWHTTEQLSRGGATPLPSGFRLRARWWRRCGSHRAA